MADITLVEGDNVLNVGLAPIVVFDPWVYDFNGDGYIDNSERAAAGFDYFDGKITKEQYEQVVALPAPPPPPVTTLHGVVTDAQTGYPLEGVKVSIDGLVTYTDNIGRYAFSGLSPGIYLMTLEKEGYEICSGTVTIVAGDNEINTEITLIPALMANLYGVVTDAETGSPLSGVKVTIAGLVMYTDASGNYGFAELSPGGYTITFEKEGYETLVR